MSSFGSRSLTVTHPSVVNAEGIAPGELVVGSGVMAKPGAWLSGIEDTTQVCFVVRHGGLVIRVPGCLRVSFDSMVHTSRRHWSAGWRQARRVWTDRRYGQRHHNTARDITDFETPGPHPGSGKGERLRTDTGPSAITERVAERRGAVLALVLADSHLHILGGRYSSWYHLDTMM